MRIGIDLGGTKIEGIVLGPDGRELARMRVATPREATATTPCCRRVAEAGRGARGAGAGARCSVGVGTPGFLSPATGLILNSNLASLNGQGRSIGPVAARLGRPGAGRQRRQLLRAVRGHRRRRGARGGAGRPGTRSTSSSARRWAPASAAGIVIDGRVLNGANGSAAEWSHTTLPFIRRRRTLALRCFCGHPRCIESFISGRGLAGAYRAVGRDDTRRPRGRPPRRGRRRRPPTPRLRRLREPPGARPGRRHQPLDPHVIVLGGGVSNNPRIFDNVPKLLGALHRRARSCARRLVRAQHGDASGVRGAAWLWPDAPVGLAPHRELSQDSSAGFNDRRKVSLTKAGN